MHDRPETSPPPAAPIRPISYAPAEVISEQRADGSLLLRARMPLQHFNPSLAGLFRAAVEAQPGRVFLAERAGEGWRKLT